MFRSHLVPVFAFGENNLFNQVKNPPGSTLRKVQEKIQSKIAFAPTLFYGRGVFQYTFGMIPHRRPVNVVGKLMIFRFVWFLGNVKSSSVLILQLEPSFSNPQGIKKWLKMLRIGKLKSEETQDLATKITKY